MDKEFRQIPKDEPEHEQFQLSINKSSGSESLVCDTNLNKVPYHR